MKIYGIVKDSVHSVQIYISGYKLNYPVVISDLTDNTLKQDYEINFIPTTLIIDDSSRVVKSYVGVLTKNQEYEIISEMKKVANKRL